MTAESERVATMIAESSNIVVIGHERPDGDAIGSLLALTLALKEVGKQVWPLLDGGLPKKWHFLPGADLIKSAIPTGEHLIIAVDAADIHRLGALDVSRVDVNIDHHPSNTNFGTINLVDPEASATTVVLHRLLPELDVPMHVDIASNLLTGLITDTLGFRTNSVNPEALRVAAELIEAGADISRLYRKAMYRRSYEAAHYWAHGLSRMEMRDGVVWSSLLVSDRKQAKYPGTDDADLIDVLTTIEGPRVAVLFIEQADGNVKISWRALPGVDVSRLAATFGGGGHELAAGAMIEGGVQEVMDRVLNSTFAALGS
ncbi:MAG: bifunctional oligoribonuclease/PAP phosphatase NrnA [Anaerolineales bacterium]